MKKAFVSIVLTAVLAAMPEVARAAEEGTTAVIERLNSEFVGAWNAHDATRMASIWADDGDLINPFGQKANGRAAIEKLFDAEQAGVMKATTYKIESFSVRELDRRTAIGDWEAVLTGLTDRNGNPIPPFRHHVSTVYVEQGGHWWVAAVRAYAFQPIPGTSAK